MLPLWARKNWNTTYKFFGKVFKIFSADRVLAMEEVGKEW